MLVTLSSLQEKYKMHSSDVTGSGLFDPVWYVANYPDVLSTNLSPLEHFLRFGILLGRDPGPRFDGAYYLQKYNDVAASGINPFFHYLKYGRKEGRMINDNEPPARALPESSQKTGGGIKCDSIELQQFGGHALLKSSTPTIMICAHVAGKKLFGGERSFLDMVEGVYAAGYNVISVVPAGSSPDYIERLLEYSVKVYSFPYGWWRKDVQVNDALVKQFSSIAKKENVAAVYANTIMLREPLRAAKNVGAKGLVHVRELIPFDKALCGLIGLSPEEIVGEVITQAEYIIANSEATARIFPKPNFSYVVKNTIDVQQFDIENRVDEKCITAALISSNLPKKGIYDVVEIAKLLKAHSGRIKILIIGPTNEHSENLAKELNKFGLTSIVDFVGYQEQPLDAIAKANIVLSLSHFQESFGRTCLEAMAARRPVVGYHWGAVPELVQNDVNGYLVSYLDYAAVAERLIDLICQPEKISRLGNAGRELALQQYCKRAYAEALRGVFEKILPSKDVAVNSEKKTLSVSVIIPNYNYEEFLPARIKSILAQTHQPSEIIFLDDSSSDNSVDMAKMLLENCGIPCRFLINDTNRGTYNQWSLGIREASGDYIWIAEADDDCDPSFLATLVSKLSDRKIVIAYAQSRIIDENGALIREDNRFHTNDLSKVKWSSDYVEVGLREVVDHLFYRNSIPNVSACIIARAVAQKAVDGLASYRYCGDWLFYARILQEGSIGFVSSPLNYFRRHSQSVTRSKGRTLDYLREILSVRRYIVDNFPIHKMQIEKGDQFLDRDYKIDGVRKNSHHELSMECKKQTHDVVNERMRVVFLTTNNGSHNGGSEVLWVESAIRMREQQHDVMVLIKNWQPEPAFFKRFDRLGVKVHFKESLKFEDIISFSPDLFVISTGDQDEGTEWFKLCQENGIQYVIINQLTKERRFWPIRENKTNDVRNGYLAAKKVFFTCWNNHRVMEDRLECELRNADLHFNPFHFDRSVSIPFPSMESGLRIAMPARLLLIHKGQHLALEVMSLPKWRSRSVTLNLYGEGPDEGKLKKMVEDMGLNNVFFHQRTPDLTEIWSDNHAILMPSFMEGLPIVLVGAMMCGRVPIVTDIGGHREVIQDGECGFLAKDPDVVSVDDALERAYARRREWPSIAEKARSRILEIFPEDPVDHFIKKLNACVN